MNKRIKCFLLAILIFSLSLCNSVNVYAMAGTYDSGLTGTQGELLTQFFKNWTIQNGNNGTQLSNVDWSAYYNQYLENEYNKHASSYQAKGISKQYYINSMKLKMGFSGAEQDIMRDILTTYSDDKLDSEYLSKYTQSYVKMYENGKDPFGKLMDENTYVAYCCLHHIFDSNPEGKSCEEYAREVYRAMHTVRDKGAIDFNSTMAEKLDLTKQGYCDSKSGSSEIYNPFLLDEEASWSFSVGLSGTYIDYHDNYNPEDGDRRFNVIEFDYSGSMDLTDVIQYYNDHNTNYIYGGYVMPYIVYDGPSKYAGKNEVAFKVMYTQIKKSDNSKTYICQNLNYRDPLKNKLDAKAGTITYYWTNDESIPFFVGSTTCRRWQRGKFIKEDMAGTPFFAMQSNNYGSVDAHIEGFSTSLPCFASDDEAMDAYMNRKYEGLHNYDEDEYSSALQRLIGALLDKNTAITSNPEYDPEADLDDAIGKILSSIASRFPENPSEDDIKKSVGEVMDPAIDDDSRIMDPITDVVPKPTESDISKGILQNIFDFLTGGLFDLIKSIYNVLKNIWDAIIDVGSKVVNAEIDIVNALSGTVTGTTDFTDVITAITDAPAGIIDAIKENWLNITASISIFADSIVNPVKAIAQGILDIPQEIADIFECLIENVGDISISIPQIIQGILDIPLDIIDWFTIDMDAIQDAVDINTFKHHNYIPYDDAENLFRDFLTMEVEYPKLTINTPTIIKQYYHEDIIVLLDFYDWKDTFFIVRAVLQFSFWLWEFCYLLGGIRPRFVIDGG